jgi:hypothetical protein
MAVARGEDAPGEAAEKDVSRTEFFFFPIPRWFCWIIFLCVHT